MGKDTDNTAGLPPELETSPGEQDGSMDTTTLRICQSHFTGEVKVNQYAYLEIFGHGEQPRSVDLDEGELLIGRNPECQIQLQIHGVSRRHARVLVKNEEYHIEDLGSTNGIYLNGIRVAKAVLRNNDQIEIGGVRILFCEKSLQNK